MAKFITLISWTDQGIRSFRDTVKRADDAAALAERMGGTFEAIWWTLGPHDAVALADFPDDETETAFLLAVGSQGNVRTTTMRAFTREEMEGIIAKAG